MCDIFFIFLLWEGQKLENYILLKQSLCHWAKHNNHMSLNKVLMYKQGKPKKPGIFLLTPTGVAAININGKILILAWG